MLLSPLQQQNTYIRVICPWNIQLIYCRIPFILMEDCSYRGVPIWPTAGYKASQWPIHSFSNPGFTHVIGFRPTISLRWITWKKSRLARWKCLYNCINAGKTVCLFLTRWDLFVSVKCIMRERAVETPMLKYWYNSHHIEVNFTQWYVVWSSHYDSEKPWPAFQSTSWLPTWVLWSCSLRPQ